MPIRQFINTPFSEEVGYTIKVVNGPPLNLNGAMPQQADLMGIPFASVGSRTTGGFVAPPRTTGGCYQVQTPQGNVLMKAYTPGYYNPPLAYDRCSTPRPFGPQPTGAGGCKCGCGCQGSCGSGCGAKPPVPAGQPSSGGCGCGAKGPGQAGGCGCGAKGGGAPGHGHGCSCPQCKAVMMGYAGESDEPMGPSYRHKRYQAGYFAPEYVNGPRYIPTVGQLSRKAPLSPSQAIMKQQEEKKITRELLKGNIDALIDFLAEDQGGLTAGSGKICMKQPSYEEPTQFTHLFSEPRSFDLQLSSPMSCSGGTVGGCGCGANMNAPIQSYYSCIERAQDESRGVCPRQFQGYWNPWGQVNGPPTVGKAGLQLSKDAVDKLTNLLVVSTGFNPDQNPKLRQIVETKLDEALAKEGITVVAGQVSGPGTTGFLADLIRGITGAVSDTTNFVGQTVVNPMQQFVRKNATTVSRDMASVDRQLGVTSNLQQFVQTGGLANLQQQLGQNVQWPELAALGFGLAGPAVGLPGIAPVLGALGDQGVGGGLGAVSQSMQSLLGGGGATGQLLQQNGQFGGMIGKQPNQQLMGGQQGLLQLIGSKAQVDTQKTFSGLQGLGRQVVQPGGQGLDFNALAGLLGARAGLGAK